jgi:hypothetical protein
VAPDRRDNYRREDAGHDGQQHAAAPRGAQRAAKDDDRQHGAEGELQPDRLVYQSQDGNDDTVGNTPRQRDRLRSHIRQRDGEHRQRGRAEKVRPRGIRRERNPERQQRDQHRNHQPALGPSPPEQHHTHDQHKTAHVNRGRHPAQSKRHREVVSGHQAHQFTGEAATDEAERVVDGVVRHPIHVKRNDIDREAQHHRRPDRNPDRDADVQHGVGALTGLQAQVHHRIGPNRQLLRTGSGRPMRPARVHASMLRCAACRCRTRRSSGIDCR